VPIDAWFHPHRLGLEAERELTLDAGAVLAGRYRVVAPIGVGFSCRVVQCWDARDAAMVAVKVVKNADKDALDQGMGEAHVMQLLRESDPDGRQPLQRLRGCFYYREHLCLVTELLGEPLSALCDPCAPGSTRARLAPDALGEVALHLLGALQHMHGLDLVHCDVKPDNVCLVCDTPRQVKLIDFGSCVAAHDEHNSYTQSRWYRAPEVMLGLPWDAVADMWSLGCTLGELFLGHVLFHGRCVRVPFSARAPPLTPHHAPRA
jgi:serine/threonine protein kinase